MFLFAFLLPSSMFAPSPHTTTQNTHQTRIRLNKFPQLIFRFRNIAVYFVKAKHMHTHIYIYTYG